MHVSGAESAQSAAAASLSLVPQTGEGLDADRPASVNNTCASDGRGVLSGLHLHM